MGPKAHLVIREASRPVMKFMEPRMALPQALRLPGEKGDREDRLLGVPRIAGDITVAKVTLS